MYSLYLDTSQKINIGLYKKDSGWLEYLILDTRNSSKDLHKEINLTLKGHGLEVRDLSRTIFCAGPGSYTGIRVSEGIAQVFEMHDMLVNSFPVYDIPSIFGVESGLWVAMAYKSEYFCFSWEKGCLLYTSDAADES